jgi:hypothetical protein
MVRTLSTRNAKERAISLCEVLAAANPKLSDRTLQNAAIDLHDIEEACAKGHAAISELRRHDPKGKAKTREMLIGIDIGILDEIAHHTSSLRRYFRAIGVRDSIPKGKARNRKTTKAQPSVAGYGSQARRT